MQLQLYRTVNDGKEYQERDSLWTYDKVDIEKKWDFSLRKEFFIENPLQWCNYNFIEQSL